ncbi:MAG: hypothetical protein M3440_10390, partial [Chloroflexota bacterium]|nr:hypothetical protein [Chloroflexota bacterium]
YRFRAVRSSGTGVAEITETTELIAGSTQVAGLVLRLRPSQVLRIPIAPNPVAILKRVEQGGRRRSALRQTAIHHFCTHPDSFEVRSL